MSMTRKSWYTKMPSILASMMVIPLAGRRPLNVASWLLKHFKKEYTNHEDETADAGSNVGSMSHADRHRKVRRESTRKKDSENTELKLVMR
jgi:hypothetical protein